MEQNHDKEETIIYFLLSFFVQYRKQSRNIQFYQLKLLERRSLSRSFQHDTH